MIKGKLMWLWIVTLVVLLVVGVAVASLKYNASPQAIELTLSISGMVLALLGRLFSRGDKETPVESPSEKKLVSSLNALIGWSVLAFALGEVFGFNMLGYLIRRGLQPSGYEVLFLVLQQNLWVPLGSGRFPSM